MVFHHQDGEQGMGIRTGTVIALIALGIATASAGTPHWVQTAQGRDASDGTPSLHSEYVVPTSIKQLRGDQRTAFVKVTYAPGIEGIGGGTAITEIDQVTVGCSDMSWGNISTMSFDARMVPLMASIGTYDTTKPVWTLKSMQALDPKSITYKTAQYICKAVVS